MIWKFCAYGFLKNLRFFEPFLYLFFLARGMSFFQIGLLIGIREFTQTLLEIPTGVLADITGKRRSMEFCFSSYIVSFILFYFGKGFALFACAFVLFGLGEALRTGTHKAIILDYLDTKGLAGQKTRYYGLTRSWSLIGSSINALLAGGLVFLADSYDYVFIAATVPYAFGLALMVSYPKYLDRTQPGASAGFAVDVKHHLRRMVRAFAATKGLLRGLLNSSLFDAMFKVQKDYIQPILQSYVLLAGGLFAASTVITQKRQISLLMGLSFFCIYIFSAMASRNAHKVEKRLAATDRALNMLYIAFAGLLLLVGLLRGLQVFLPIIFIFLLMYVLINLRRPIMIGYLGDKMDKQRRASLLSVEAQLKSLFAMVLAPVLGFLADTFGVAWVFFGSVCLMVAILPVIVLRTDENKG